MSGLITAGAGLITAGAAAVVPNIPWLIGGTFIATLYPKVHYYLNLYQDSVAHLMKVAVLAIFFGLLTDHTGIAYAGALLPTIFIAYIVYCSAIQTTLFQLHHPPVGFFNYFKSADASDKSEDASDKSADASDKFEDASDV
jgi:hypothetical protein